MSMIAVVISALALALSLYTFFSFDAKLKKQESILNDYKIKEYKEAEHNKLCANLSTKTYWRDKGTLYLIIENAGPSDAYNVSIKNLDKDSFLFQELDSSFPINTIEAGDSIQLELFVYSDIPQKNRVKLTWKDDSKEMHTEKVILHIFD